MDEKELEKIEKIITDYRKLFDATDMDVARSIKGEWYFSRFNEEYGYYDCFVRFKTARELVEIILGELSLDLLLAIESEPSEIPPFENFADHVEMQECYRPYVERLIKLFTHV